MILLDPFTLMIGTWRYEEHKAWNIVTLFDGAKTPFFVAMVLLYLLSIISLIVLMIVGKFKNISFKYIKWLFSLATIIFTIIAFLDCRLFTIILYLIILGLSSFFVVFLDDENDHSTFVSLIALALFAILNSNILFFDGEKTIFETFGDLLKNGFTFELMMQIMSSCFIVAIIVLTILTFFKDGWKISASAVLCLSLTSVLQLILSGPHLNRGMHYYNFIVNLFVLLVAGGYFALLIKQSVEKKQK